MHSFTEENYIKAIYKLLESNDETVSTNAIAERMNTKAASVTDMLKKLSAKKLVNYQKYQGVTLTAKGEKTALNIIRKHRLWEMFLVEKFNFTWDEVHDVAEQLEHIQSEKLIDELDKFLNFPKVDPHGDPIPDAKGKLHLQKSKPLSQFNIDDVCVITGVVDHSPSFLRYLDKQGFVLGNEIKIKDMADFDRSLQISVNKRASFFISNDVAKNILVIAKQI
ncbi:MAG: metal-dependent transcriptional regulator [Bacteroidota bacterium]|jgi:DtxR family Mn-dependent transcriptional regulator|nr:metal-dependent transcriptional regulator [Bacteroidota bacterium]